LPKGGKLTTLDDARSYILDLPAELQTLTAWQHAIEALLLVGDHGGPEMLPRIGMMKALYPNPPPREPRRKATKVYKIIR
jgi:hypothetical protein